MEAVLGTRLGSSKLHLGSFRVYLRSFKTPFKQFQAPFRPVLGPMRVQKCHKMCLKRLKMKPTTLAVVKLESGQGPGLYFSHFGLGYLERARL